MKLYVPDYYRATRKALVPLIGGLVHAATAMPKGAMAQQTQADSGSSASLSP